MNAPVRTIPIQDRLSEPLFTAAEFVAMLECGAFVDMKVELEAGRITKMAPASGGHSKQNFRIGELLSSAFKAGGLQVNLGTDLAVRIDEGTVRGIDLAISLDDFAEKGATTADSIWLAVEIADTTVSRDLGDKAADYGRAGIPHYWVVDLGSRAIHTMVEPCENGYNVRQLVRFGEPLDVPGTSETIIINV